jgi:hypothetical protein
MGCEGGVDTDIQWVFFPIMLNRDVNMLKYLAGS